MLNYLKFKNLNNIELAELTNNTIILFSDKYMLFDFQMEIHNLIMDNNYEGIEYSLDDESEELNIETSVAYSTFGIYRINEQRIIIALENTIIFQIQDVKDLWFIDKDENGKLECCVLTDFEGHERYIDDNVRLFKAVCQGKFGSFGVYKNNKLI